MPVDPKTALIEVRETDPRKEHPWNNPERARLTIENYEAKIGELNRLVLELSKVAEELLEEVERLRGIID